MFENIFKKDATATSVTSEAEKSPANAPMHAVAALSVEETQVWRDRIAAAASDDTTLLQLTHDAPGVPLKLAAIEALTHEASFKQAMHDFREHDKRLYRAAKSRWEAISGKRIATDEATALIASARALIEQESVPVNRVVELDHAWAALNSDLLDPDVRTQFSALSEQLGSSVRSRGEHGQAITRWLSATDQAMRPLQSALPSVARGETPSIDAEPLAVALLELISGNPDTADERCNSKADAAKRLLALASSVTQRAAFLQTLPVAGPIDSAADAENQAREKQLIEQWRAFPEIADYAESEGNECHTLLTARFAEWRNAATQERESEQAARTTEERERLREQNKQRVSTITRDIEAAETAHTQGHVADLTRLLLVIDTALKRGSGSGSISTALTQRIEVLRAEQRRLQEWQRWGGRQGREQLVTEAKALAAEVTDTTAKIAIKPHAEVIDKLRERWKELDKLGAASNQVMWLDFDSALKKAYAPVSAHLEKLKVERNENLSKREKIVEALAQSAAKFFPAAVSVAQESAAASPDWRAISHALEEAQLNWRKLGPVEHTVPRKAQKGDNAITARYAAAVQSLEAPLKNAYGEARSKREALVIAAKTLAESDVTARDIVDKVKKLQSQWQAVAKAMPLPRRDENALWIAFKSATDAIFAARDTARAAKETESNAKQQARLDIIERVSALTQTPAAADIKRALADAESAWRAAPDMRELPKPQSAKLDARYRAARDAANKRIADLTLHAEQARYDALLAAMALCEELEAAAEPGDSQKADLQTRWDMIENLPAAWKAKLELRFQGKAPSPVPKTGKNAGDALQETLLNLEVGCGINSPEEFQAARQYLKIRALKEAMEGRKTTVTTPADIERWMLEAATWPRPDGASSERLAKIIAAVRRRPSR